MSDEKMIVQCPGMHPEMLRPGSTPGVMCLNPGIAAEGSRSGYTPEGLPLDARAASAWLAQAIGYGNQFKKPGDITSMEAGQTDDFYTDSSFSIRSQLMGYEAGARDQRGKPDLILAAQMTLLLAYHAEGELLAAFNTNEGLQGAVSRFRESLGLSGEEDTEAGPAGLSALSRFDSIDDGLEAAVPWRPVVEAFLSLVPEDVIFFVDRPDIIAEWRDSGLVFRYPPRKDWGRYHEEWPASLHGRIGELQTSAAALLAVGDVAGKNTGSKVEGLRKIIIWEPEAD